MRTSWRGTALVLLAGIAAACDGGGTGSRPPATVTATTPTTMTATVATAVATAPTVRVQDERGRGVRNVPVTFTVTGGGGSVGLASATTDAEGVASAGSWMLGTAAGVNTLMATVAALPPVQFTATGTAGAPAVLIKAAGDNQQARAGSPVPVAPSVIVTDATGNLVPGVVVTFVAASGGGSVTGASVTTGADGRATVGSWTLGTVGPNTLTATAGSAGSTTFIATALDPCTSSVPYTLRTALNGTLATGDCRLSTGELIDFYQTGSASGLVEEFLLTSTAIDAYLVLYDAAGRALAFDDNGAGGNNSSIRVIAPAGQYILGASSFAAGQTGAYELSSRALPARTNCVEAWIVPGVTFNGTLASGDCTLSNGKYHDTYLVYLRAGQQITIMQRSTTFDTYLILTDGSGVSVAENDDGGGGTDSRIAYTAPRAGAYMIRTSSFSNGATGTYSLSLTTP